MAPQLVAEPVAEPVAKPLVLKMKPSHRLQALSAIMFICGIPDWHSVTNCLNVADVLKLYAEAAHARIVDDDKEDDKENDKEDDKEDDKEGDKEDDKEDDMTDVVEGTTRCARPKLIALEANETSSLVKSVAAKPAQSSSSSEEGKASTSSAANKTGKKPRIKDLTKAQRDQAILDRIRAAVIAAIDKWLKTSGRYTLVNEIEIVAASIGGFAHVTTNVSTASDDDFKANMTFLLSKLQALGTANKIGMYLAGRYMSELAIRVQAEMGKQVKMLAAGQEASKMYMGHSLENTNALTFTRKFCGESLSVVEKRIRFHDAVNAMPLLLWTTFTYSDIVDIAPKTLETELASLAVHMREKWLALDVNIKRMSKGDTKKNELALYSEYNMLITGILANNL